MSVLNPIFYYGFFCLAIPIAIHFFGSRRHKQIFISNISLLTEVKKDTLTVNKILHFILLFLRLLLFLFLVTAFLKPVSEIKNTKSGIINTVFYADNSPSICENTENKEIREIKEKLLKKTSGLVYPENCELNSSSLLSYINRNEYGKHKIILSDFQTNLESHIYGIGQGNYTLVYYENKDRTYNVFVDSLWFSQTFVKVNSDLRLFVRLKNSGTTSADNVISEFKANDVSVGSKTVSIQKESSIVIEYPFFLKTSELKGEVVIKDNSWNFDNHFYFTIGAKENFKVVQLRLPNTNKNLVKTAFEQEKAFKVTELNGSGLKAQQASESDLIVVEGLNGIKVSSLMTLVKNGTNIMFFPNSAFSISDAEEISKVTGRKILIKKQSVQPEVPEHNNPFFQNVFEKKPSGTLLPEISLICSPVNPDRIILKATSGVPIISQIAIGKGSIYFAGFDLNENVNFTRSAFFLPILYRIAERSVVMPKVYYHGNSTSIEVHVNNSRQETYKLVNNQNVIVPEQKIENGIIRLFIPETGLAPGFWKIKNEKDSLINNVALNYPKSESILSFIPFETLKSEFSDRSNIKVIKSKEFSNSYDESEEVSSGWKNWKSLLSISLLFLILEIAVVRLYRFRQKQGVQL